MSDYSKELLNNQNNTKSYIANTMPEIRKQQIYIAEIGQKRQLSNLIYQSILKTYQSIMQTMDKHTMLLVQPF